MIRRSRLAVLPRLERLDQRLVLSALTPAQIDSAYGLNAVSFSNGSVKGNGQGQTIAIIDAYHDPSILSDLIAFDAKYGLSDPYLTPSLPSRGDGGVGRPAFSMVNFAGSSTNTGWNEEEALDVEMAHAAAPGANIVLVEAKSSGLFDFLTAIKAVETLPSVSVISMSWGGPEFNGEQGFDSTFKTPVGHTGITFLASSGDDGAGAQWPASSPNVVGVGGTSLVAVPTGVRSVETAWAGSGGGVSQFESIPSYQTPLISGKLRSSPDVASVADPGTGLVIVTRGGQVQVGGTSMSSPIWAGLMAIADEGQQLASGTTLDGATQTLPDLYKAPSGSFFDITSGTRAGTGYDTSTGLGSPNGSTLIRYLAGNGKVVTTNGGGTGVSTSGSTSLGAAILSSPTPSYTVPLPRDPVLGSSLAMELVPLTTSNELPISAAVDQALASWDLSELATVRRIGGFRARG